MKEKETHQNRLIEMEKITRCIWDHALYLPLMRNHSWLLILPLMGCSLPSPHPPAAEFLVADGSSTFWVTSGPQGIHARVSPSSSRAQAAATMKFSSAKQRVHIRTPFFRQSQSIVAIY